MPMALDWFDLLGSSTANYLQTTAHLNELQSLFSFVTGNQAENHARFYSNY